MAKLLVFLLAMTMLIMACLAAPTTTPTTTSAAATPTVDDPTRSLDLSTITTTSTISTTTTAFSTETPYAKRELPDPNAMVKLAQNGLRNMMVVAKLTADQELNMLQPKKPKVNPADDDNSEFGVSANPNAGKQQKTPATGTKVPVDA